MNGLAKTAKKSTAKKGSKKNAETAKEAEVRWQVSVVILFVLGVFSFLAIYGSAMGKIGELFRSLFGLLLGGGAYLFPFWFVGVAVYAFIKKGRKIRLRTSVSALLLVFLSGLAESVVNSKSFMALIDHGRDLSGGGVLGGGLYLALRTVASRAGATIILAALAVISVLIITEFSVRDFIKGMNSAEKAVRERDDEEPAAKPKKKKAEALDFDDFVPEQKSHHESRMRMRPLKPIIDIPLDDDEEGKPEPVPENQKAAVFDEIPEPPEEEEYVPMEVVPKASKRKPKEEQPAKKEVKNDKDTEFVPDEKNDGNVRYIAPPITLLSEHKGGSGLSQKDLKINSQKLVDILQSFGVTAKVIGASVGPTVTRYEIVAASGTKVTKITGLSEDIALHMGVSGVRIAPVPEHSALGVEIPNESSVIVNIRDCIETPEFEKSKSKIAFALGKDISGKVIIADIAKMPHLLIAGSTGSGKSVCINTIILSILYKAAPSEVKLLMIDPKVVELKVYNGIPHLVSPVVTDPKKAANALNWAVSEMSRRYKLFADSGVRNIKGYNELAEKDDTLKKLEHIVIIIDELADLMMAAPNEVEDAIQRLAQLARAAGMHLVVATQRPSVNVITGVIKANIPSRIAFAVSSQIDSRTILDVSGAEKLLGKGDMLYHPIGAPKSVRVQGSFVSDEDVEAVVDFVKNNSDQVQYNEDAIEFIKREPEQKGKGKDEEDEEDIWDVRLSEAVDIVMKMGSASTSMLQRKMGVGYARAARMVDQLEQQGIVGPPDGSKPREVLMTRQQYLEMVNYKENEQKSMDEYIETAEAELEDSEVQPDDGFDEE